MGIAYSDRYGVPEHAPVIEPAGLAPAGLSALAKMRQLSTNSVDNNGRKTVIINPDKAKP